MPVDAAIVGEHLEVGGVAGGDRRDQLVGDAAQSESADGEQRTRRDVRNGRLGRLEYLGSQVQYLSGPWAASPPEVDASAG